jgi:hypothetical protein
MTNDDGTKSSSVVARGPELLWYHDDELSLRVASALANGSLTFDTLCNSRISTINANRFIERRLVLLIVIVLATLSEKTCGIA